MALLRFDRSDTPLPFASAAQAIGMPYTEHRIQDLQARALYAYRYVLIRPDGHVAWRSQTPPVNARHILDTARGALSKELHP
jgi:hypothetical protein